MDLTYILLCILIGIIMILLSIIINQSKKINLYKKIEDKYSKANTDDKATIQALKYNIIRLKSNPSITFRTEDGALARHVTTKTIVDNKGNFKSITHTIRRKNVGGKFDNITVYPTMYIDNDKV
jgi:hypothetical protein